MKNVSVKVKNRCILKKQIIGHRGSVSNVKDKIHKKKDNTNYKRKMKNKDTR